jgi:hypothetical protein
MLNNVQINVEFSNQGIPFALFWVCKTMHTPLPKNIGTVAGFFSMVASSSSPIFVVKCL